MAWVSILGKTVGNMKESINLIRRMDMEYTCGLMVDDMMDSGLRANSKVKAFTHFPMEL